MDLIKKLTGKNPSEYEYIAKKIIDEADEEHYKKLVGQDDFLFDFIKSNVAKRLMHACNKDNYLNLLKFFKYYSASYDTMIAEVLHNFGGSSVFDKIKELYLNGSNDEKAYAVKYFFFADENLVKTLVENLRNTAKSDFEPLSINSIEVLSRINDNYSKNEALKNLDKDDEFEVMNAVKFLTVYGAKDSLPKIIDVMKKSSFSENIAAEIPYLVSLSEILETDRENGLLIICYIINALPDILPLSVVLDFDLGEILYSISLQNPDSASAVLLKLAKDKFEEMTSNEEYLFDSDKNTKDEIKKINEFLKTLNDNKLKSLIYDELFDKSDFVFFAVDYADDIEELETLLESSNQTLILKVLGRIKELGLLNPVHKETALSNITIPEIKTIASVL